MIRLLVRSLARVRPSDGGLVVVLVEEPAEVLREEVLRAVGLCPSRSLRVLG